MPTKEEVEAAIAAVEGTIATLDTWVLWFAALVAVGVVGEAVLGVAHWMKDRELRPLRVMQAQLHENEIAQLDKDTARLSADAELARAAIADANARTAEAQLALEKLKTWRSMTCEQQAQIVATLSQFKGAHFDIAVLVGDPEALNFAGLVGPTLKLAQWEWIEYNHPTGPLMNVTTFPELPIWANWPQAQVFLYLSTQTTFQNSRPRPPRSQTR
jgi:hypothetical protein